MREFWRIGLDALQKYAKDPNGAYKGPFESMSSTNQLTLLQDLWGDKPTSFNNIRPSDFAYELTFMTWAGFLMDPIYGGNQNMVGRTYTGFNGLNFANFNAEGKDEKASMAANTRTRQKPASVAQHDQHASG